MTLGILALQGDVQAHTHVLQSLGAHVREVRDIEDLNGISGMVLPGGESSTMIHLLEKNRLWEAIVAFGQEKPVWGTCAGAILLAKEVSHPQQKSMNLIDMSIERNGYGRQVDSFVAELKPSDAWPVSDPIEGIFIRAPKIKSVGTGVKELLYHEEEVVCVERANVLASTFHPELTEQNFLHNYFLEKCHRG